MSMVQKIFLLWISKFFYIPLADLRGAPGTHVPPIQILSFSCSFRQKNCKIIPIWKLAHPPGENPGSATAYDYTVLYFKTVDYFGSTWIQLAK